MIALSFLDVAQDLATATDPASPIDIGGFDIPIQAAGMLLAGAAQYAGREVRAGQFEGQADPLSMDRWCKDRVPPSPPAT